MRVGIEAINAYCGQTYIDVRALFEARGLDMARFNNLMMEKKSVGLPCEDPVTNGVNAAKPIIDRLSAADKSKIELVITSTESGLDFGKSLSTYIHKYLELDRNCRLFEVKQACYGGTAALQMAVNFIKSNASPGAKALVISTDCARAAAKMTYAEPSQGVAAVAMLVGDQPEILELDFGMNGYHGYEVLDTCRPEPHIETGDPDLSLLSYLDCLENSFKNYCKRRPEANFQTSFDYLAFHTPFAGMVRGGHRTMMRKFLQATPDIAAADFDKRVQPSLKYCVEVGNVYSATLYLALCGLIDTAIIGDSPKKVGLFSYGSGCSSEFYSGHITQASQDKLRQMQIGAHLQNRYNLPIAEYDRVLDLTMEWMFGTKNKQVDNGPYNHIYDRHIKGKGYLTLKGVKEYERTYIWS